MVHGFEIGGHVSLGMCIVNEIGGFNFGKNGKKIANIKCLKNYQLLWYIVSIINRVCVVKIIYL